jgi:pimeloyl-ACP methyl ester carboxylesterase
MRIRLLIVCIAAAALMGCSAMTPGHPEAVSPVTQAPRVGNAFLLRGFIGVFSTGIDHLGAEVNAAGVHGAVFQDDQWSALADSIAAHYRGHPEAEPLVLVGHSYGADDAINIARRLDQANVPVNLLITLDPVTPRRVPGNVRLCVNLYQSNGIWDNLPWLRGIPLQQEPGSKGVLINSNIRTDRTDLLYADLNHFNIEKKQKVHDEVLRLLKEVCPTRQQWELSRSNKSPATPPPSVAELKHLPPSPQAAATPLTSAGVEHVISN